MKTMLFCKNCGSQLSESDRFCAKCGTPVSGNIQPEQIMPNQAADISAIHKYTGTAKQLPFACGMTIEVSAARDAMNEYINQFHKLVNSRMLSFREEYRRHCSTFDGYMENFVEINANYVRELEDEAVGLLFSYGYFNFTVQDIFDVFKDAPAFKAIEEFHDNNMELGNAYLQDNYNQAVNKANRMPGQTFFGTGLGGMMLSYGLSAPQAETREHASDISDRAVFL